MVHMIYCLMMVIEIVNDAKLINRLEKKKEKDQEETSSRSCQTVMMMR